MMHMEVGARFEVELKSAIGYSLCSIQSSTAAKKYGIANRRRIR
jgi:hypothetical protein